MNEIRKSRCVAIMASPPCWSILTENLFYQLVNLVRQELERDIANNQAFDESALVGTKAKDNAYVLRALRSNTTEKEFIAAPLTWIYDALLYLAQSDAWYAIEKDWADKNIAQQIDEDSILEAEEVRE